jgi:hypothetical protein
MAPAALRSVHHVADPRPRGSNREGRAMTPFAALRRPAPFQARRTLARGLALIGLCLFAPLTARAGDVALPYA